MTDLNASFEDSDLVRRLPPHDDPVISAHVADQLALIQRYVPLSPRTRVLEVGCGNGYFSTRLAGLCDLVGVDISAAMLRANPVKTTARMDGAHLGFADESFDVVLCQQTLHHAADPQGIVREMARVTRRDVVVVEPNRNNPLMILGGLLVPQERAALRYSLGYVRRMVEDAGLVVREAFSYGAIVPAITPRWALGLARGLSFRQPFGWENVVIARRPGR